MRIREVVLAVMIMRVCLCYAPGPVNEHGIRQNAQLYMPLDLDVQEDDDQPGYDTQEEYDDDDQRYEGNDDGEQPIR